MAVVHGTRRRYVHGCRCDDCARANSEWQRSYNARGTKVTKDSRPAERCDRCGGLLASHRPYYLHRAV